MNQSALLIIDVQLGVFMRKHHDGMAVYQEETLLSNINTPTGKARSANAPVIYIQHMYTDFPLMEKGQPTTYNMAGLRSRAPPTSSCSVVCLYLQLKHITILRQGTTPLFHASLVPERNGHNMDIYEAINGRRTVRDFEDRQIDMSVIEKIIDAGLKAPTTDHMRSWEFVVVNDKSVRANIVKTIPDTTPIKQNDISNWLDSWESTDKMQRDMYFEALPKQSSMLYHAGCLIIPLFKHEGSLLKPETISSLNGFASIWCCIENILLAAVAEGILGVTRIPRGKDIPHVKNLLGHPDNYIMPCYIALGYPAKNAVMVAQKEISAKERIHLDKW